VHATTLGMLMVALSACGSEDGGKETGAGRFPGGTDPLPPLPQSVTLPIVFVHGFAGSAQQYQSQAMRFVANGYPQDHIRAFEHNGGPVGDDFVAGLSAFVDTALADFGTSQVYLVGHSRGTSVSSTYLGTPANAAKVAKYVSLDGSGCGAADTAGVACLELNQAMFPGQKHVEVATSKESFVEQYAFLVGDEPSVSDIVPQADPVRISGRAVNFPENTGRDATTLEVYEVDAATGERLTGTPLATFQLGSDGSWGPVTVAPDQFYEMALSGSASPTTQHIYSQRYLRNSDFVRLLSGAPDSPTRLNTNVGEHHAALITLRMREWMTSDVLEISTASESGDQAAVNVITDTLGGNATFPPIAIHLHDAADSPGDTSLGPLPYFSTQPFQTGVDVFMPAADPPDGVITVTNLPRGETSRPQVLHFPNWASSKHILMAMFSDFVED